MRHQISNVMLATNGFLQITTSLRHDHCFGPLALTTALSSTSACSHLTSAALLRGSPEAKLSPLKLVRPMSLSGVSLDCGSLHANCTPA